MIPGDTDHPGETAEQVAARADAVLARARPLLEGGDVALVAHGHLLRVLTARWLALPPPTAACSAWTPARSARSAPSTPSR